MSSQLDITSSSKLWSFRRTHINSGNSMPSSRRRAACRQGNGFFSSNRLVRLVHVVCGCVDSSHAHNFSSTCLDHTGMPANAAYASSQDSIAGVGQVRGMRLPCCATEPDSAVTQKAVEQEKHEASASTRPSELESVQSDVVIVGAGIIGLSIAHRLLCTTDLSVALVDAAQPCAGATGAGQGYLWLGHRSPDTMAWDLAKRSKYLWEEFAHGLQALGLDPLVTIGFKKTGSLLFSVSSKDALTLQRRAEALCRGGVQAEFLNAAELRDAEPQLDVGANGSAILTPDDCQIDAQLAASYLLQEIRNHSSSGRFQEFFYEPAVNFLWEDQIRGIQTNRREIYCNKKLIMAAGGWSGQLMQNIFNRLSLSHVLPTKPRKGHLLVFEGLSQFSLWHGLMEYAYKELEKSSKNIGIASTATMDAKGRLLLGSSRQFVGFDYSLQFDVMEKILEKAIEYLPALANLQLSEALNNGSVRIGHRPYVPDGRPMIGEVAGLEGLLLATGHEGEGLSLSLGTAEMIVDMLLEEKEPVVDPSPFLPTGRLVSSG